MSLDVLGRFAQAHGAQLHVEQDAGHWSIVERPHSIAAALQAHWGRMSATDEDRRPAHTSPRASPLQLRESRHASFFGSIPLLNSQRWDGRAA
ncbi:hypothetical protein ACQR16_26515 [Bradyrhizobium oligotrophicum]|uniref:hypothetical protein n=1 Tax=Bradyrhizobium oligotrophicum TaxID=44255 RepID=UPI003EBAC4B4